jgi:c-di-GMP-binding flagellar brake protein YcgR
MNLVERRHFPRVETDYVTVEVYKPGIHPSETEVEEICPVLNLSETGMKFRAEQNFKNGQLVKLTFVLPDSMVVIRTDAIIIYISQKKDKNFMDIGVQFKNIGLTERKLISHFIAKKISETNQC